MDDVILSALKLAVRNAESRLYHAAPLGASYGQPERASLEAELKHYQVALDQYMRHRKAAA